MSESYKRYPFEYDIPPAPPPATFSIWTPDFGSSISPEVVNDTVYFTSSDSSVTITGSFEPDTLNFQTSGGNVDQVFTADAAISNRDIVYISSSDAVSPAIATSISAKNVIGFALNAAALGNPVTVRLGGSIDSLSGINPNDTLYLSDSLAGAFVTAAPSTGSAAYVVKLATGRTATSAIIDIEVRGVRA